MMGLIDEVLSCEELCDGIVEEAEFIIRSRLAETIVDVGDDVSNEKKRDLSN